MCQYLAPYSICGCIDWRHGGNLMADPMEIQHLSWISPYSMSGALHAGKSCLFQIGLYLSFISMEGGGLQFFPITLSQFPFQIAFPFFFKLEQLITKCLFRFATTSTCRYFFSWQYLQPWFYYRNLYCVLQYIIQITKMSCTFSKHCALTTVK